MIEDETPTPLIKAMIMVNIFFDRDDEKTALWFKSANPHFGNVSPLDMFLRGRGHKVVAFVEGSGAGAPQ